MYVSFLRRCEIPKQFEEKLRFSIEFFFKCRKLFAKRNSVILVIWQSKENKRSGKRSPRISCNYCRIPAENSFYFYFYKSYLRILIRIPGVFLNQYIIIIIIIIISQNFSELYLRSFWKIEVVSKFQVISISQAAMICVFQPFHFPIKSSE